VLKFAGHEDLLFPEQRVLQQTTVEPDVSLTEACVPDLHAG